MSDAIFIPGWNLYFLLGCAWIKDLVREKEMKMEKVDDPMFLNGWIVYLFHFLFPHQKGIQIQPKYFKSFFVYFYLNSWDLSKQSKENKFLALIVVALVLEFLVGILFLLGSS